jgi:hypothetical protein
VPSTVTTDQRGPGFVRIFDNIVDVGAFESQTVPSPPSPPSPPPSPGGGGFGNHSTTIVITSIVNQYPGFSQLETVTARVTDPAGDAINEGFVTFQVNGQTLIAPVHNNFVTVTFATPIFDLSILPNLFFAHTLTAAYNDLNVIFGPSNTSATVPAILFDFIFHLIAVEQSLLMQFRIA